MNRSPHDRRRRGIFGALRRAAYGVLLSYSQQVLAQEPTHPGKFAPMPAKLSIAIESLTPGANGSARYRVEVNRDDPRLSPEVSRIGAWLRRQSWDLQEDDLRTIRRLRGGVRLDVPLDDTSRLYFNLIPGNRERRDGLRWQPLADEALPGTMPLWSIGCLAHTRGQLAGREMTDEEKSQIGLTPQLSLNLDRLHQRESGSRQLTLQHGDWVDPGTGLVNGTNAWQVQLRWKF